MQSHDGTLINDVKVHNMLLAHPLYVAIEVFASSIKAYRECYSSHFYSRDCPLGFSGKSFEAIRHRDCHTHALSGIIERRKSQPQHDGSALKLQFRMNSLHVQQSLLKVLSVTHMCSVKL